MRGVYIHIPFCKSICSYCDFCKTFYYKKWSHDYLLSLQKEMEDVYLKDPIKSIYIGGGTPSSLSLNEIAFLLNLTKMFYKEVHYEFTFECNLEDITEELLKLLKQYGVNRISIGIQSFQPNNLKLLGRTHTFEDAKKKVDLIRFYGFKNINLDLIYAIPNETLKDLKEDVKAFLKLKPDHLSTYSLMIEPHTILAYKRMEKIDENLDRMMYDYIVKTLEKKKYHHYEVSNFAKMGKESKHNLGYWNNEEYYGFGLSASGYLEGIRYTNTKNLLRYLDGKKEGMQEILGKREEMDNELMLGLRKTSGVSKKEFQKKYGMKMEDAFPIKPLLKNKDLIEKKDYIQIPKDKLYVMNEILLKMI